MSPFTCPVCSGDPVKQPQCDACFGSGILRNVPYCTAPWVEVAPNLWLGGHDWQDEEGFHRETLAEHLAEAGFGLIISFYRRWGADPADHVPHYYHRIPDGELTADELDRVRAFAHRAVKASQMGTKTLIRCQAGLNRSSLCVAYALQELGYSAAEAIAHIRATRSPYALCNGDFVNYLMENE